MPAFPSPSNATLTGTTAVPFTAAFRCPADMLVGGGAITEIVDIGDAAPVAITTPLRFIAALPATDWCRAIAAAAEPVSQINLHTGAVQHG